MRHFILIAAPFLAASGTVAFAALSPAPDFRPLGRGRAMVTFHNGCVIDYRSGQRRSASRYCTAEMTAAADRRAALSGAFRMPAATAEPLVVRLPAGAIQVGFAGVACNYLFNVSGQLVRSMGTYCNAQLYARAAELQSRVRR